MLLVSASGSSSNIRNSAYCSTRSRVGSCVFVHSWARNTMKCAVLFPQKSGPCVRSKSGSVVEYPVSSRSSLLAACSGVSLGLLSPPGSSVTYSCTGKRHILTRTILLSFVNASTRQVTISGGVQIESHCPCSPLGSRNVSLAILLIKRRRLLFKRTIIRSCFGTWGSSVLYRELH